MGKTSASFASIVFLMQMLPLVDPGARLHGDGDGSARLIRAVDMDAALPATRFAAVRTPVPPEALLSGVGESIGTAGVKKPRIASVLQKVGKTLVLESTRGVKEVQLYRKTAPAVVLVLTNEGAGSGAVINHEGHIITNWHVVEGYSEVVVVFKPTDSTDLKKELAFRASIEKVDQVSDLALLRVTAPPRSLALLPLGDASTLAVGQDVHAIGHPEGEVWTYTRGTISQIRTNYTWSTSEKLIHRAKVIQTQTPVNPGNSGGPLLDDGGRLIGINSFRRQGEGLNYAVAVDVIQQFLQKKESPAASPGKRKGIDSEEARCPESYQAAGRGWPTIVGCYLSTSAPPPELWLIYTSPESRPAYAASDSVVRGQISTVIRSKDQKWENLEYYFDIDCDGTVDLIGHRHRRSGDIERYQLPTRLLSMPILAWELDNALKQQTIPYPNLRVCQ